MRDRHTAISTRAHNILRNLLIVNRLDCGGGGGAESSVVLKIRKFLNFQDAKNAGNSKIEPNWNVSGTRAFSACSPIS